MTLQVAANPLSAVIAVIVAVPAETAVTVEPLMEATFVLLLDQRTVWVVAFAGLTVATRVEEVPRIS